MAIKIQIPYAKLRVVRELLVYPSVVRYTCERNELNLQV